LWSFVVFSFWFGRAIGVEDDSLDDTRTLAEFAGAAVEMFAAGRTAIVNGG